MATFGNLTDETGTNTGWDNQKIVGKFTLGVPGAVSKLTIKIANTGTSHAACNIKGVIYADSAGSPGALVAVGTAVAVADNAAAAAVDLAFASNVNLTAANWWLGFIADSGAVGFLFYANNTSGGNTAYDWSDTYSDGPTDPFGAPDQTTTRNMAIYATYTTPAPTLTASQVASDIVVGWS